MSYHGVQFSGLALIIFGFAIPHFWITVLGLFVTLVGAYVDLTLDENSQRRMAPFHRSGPSPPPCPSCGKPLEWVPETSKYSCPTHGFL